MAGNPCTRGNTSRPGWDALGAGDALALQLGRYLQAQGADDPETLIAWLRDRLQPAREGATRLVQDGDGPQRVADRLKPYGHIHISLQGMILDEAQTNDLLQAAIGAARDTT